MEEKIYKHSAKIKHWEDEILGALRPHFRHGLTHSGLAGQVGLGRRQGLGRRGGKQRRAAFSAALGRLIATHKVHVLEGQRYLLDESCLFIPATLVRTSDNFAFARPDGWEEDVFIPGKFTRGAIPGDRLLLRVIENRAAYRHRQKEAEIVKITKKTEQPLTGVIETREGGCCFLLTDKLRLKIRVLPKNLGGAKSGDKVIAKVETRGSSISEHTAAVLSVLGDSQDPAVCSRAILETLGIPIEFEPELIAAADEINSAGIHPREAANRTDLRGEMIFTIDGEDSKDLDDAISLKLTDDGYELGVHIADVSHYVHGGSALDEEALKRGTSVYYADQVVPMLPPSLSNGICSLNPGEDRLALSVFLLLDKSGERIDYRFEKTIIRSAIKGIYAELNLLSMYGLGANPDLAEKYSGIWPTFLEMQTLAKLLIARRAAQGKMMLESVESKVSVGKDGKVEKISRRVGGFCEELIEEFMLSANGAAADFATAQGLPFVYRVHDKPAPDRLEALYEMLDRLGVSYRRAEPLTLSAELGRIIESVRGKAISGVVNSAVLRAMAKARYSVVKAEHFGLATRSYTHFTSPIRRYPDLAIHRIISACLAGGKPNNLSGRYSTLADKAAERGTEREKAAILAERECTGCYKASFMRRFLGQSLEGTVSGITPAGAFVQLENTCEGLIRPADFPPGDWTLQNPDTWIERVSGKAIKLGGALCVKVLSADTSSGRVDFGAGQEPVSQL